MLELLVKGCITLIVISLLTSCVVIEKDAQHVIPINVNKTSGDEVTLNKKSINNKPVCKNNNLFCN